MMKKATFETLSLPLDQLCLDACFSSLKLFSLYPKNHFRDSFDQLGILYPVLIYQDEGVYYLVDGFKRVDYAIKHELSALNCLVFDSKGSFSSLLDCLKIAHPLYFQSPMVQSCLLSFAIQMGLKKKDLCQQSLSCFSFNLTSHLLQDYLKLSELPSVLVQFAFQKQWSFKQCRQLITYPSELLEFYVLLLNEVSFSSSHLLLCLDLSFDLWRRDQAVLDLLQSFFSDFSFDLNAFPTSLHAYLLSLKYPRLESQRQLVEGVQKKISESGFLLDFDGSLEKKELFLKHRFRSESDISVFSSSFSMIESDMKEMLSLL